MTLGNWFWILLVVGLLVGLPDETKYPWVRRTGIGILFGLVLLLGFKVFGGPLGS